MKEKTPYIALFEKISIYINENSDEYIEQKWDVAIYYLKVYDRMWNEYFKKIPDTITKQSINFNNYYIDSGLYIWKRIHYGNDIKWSESYINIIEEIIEDYFKLPLKTIEWFVASTYGDYERVASFDKGKTERRLLFKRAMQLYKIESQKERKSSYTYKRALEDANEKFKVLTDDEFNGDFINLEQSFKIWRKRNL